MEEQPISRPKRSVIRRIGKAALWIISGALLLIVALVGLLFIYEDDIKAAVLAELNKHLKAEVKIDPCNIELTLIKTFPDCSIQFKDVLMLEALPLKKRDTLLFTRRLNLHFNISNIWHKRYDIEKISVQDAVIKLQVLKNGTPNYIFWQQGTAAAGKNQDSVRFNLKQVSINTCRLQYINRQVLFKTALAVTNIQFSGQFRQAQFDLKTDASIFIRQLVHEKTTWLENKELNFSIALSVNGSHYQFKKASIRLNNLALALEGGFTYGDSLQNLGMAFHAPSLDIASALSLLPEKFRSKTNNYKSSGNFYAQGQVNYSGKKKYSISSSFGIKNGMVVYTPTATKATGLNLTGSIKLTPTASLLELNNISLRLNNDALKGNCLIRNFSDPYLKLSTEANMRLENLQAFFPIDTLAQLKGGLKISADVEGLLRDLRNETFSTKVRLNLDATLSNLVAQFKNDAQVFTVENCDLTAHNREIEVKDLLLKRGSSDVRLNGKIPGVFNYLLDKKAPLMISGSLVADYIKLEDFMTPAGTTSANNDPLIPENILFKLSTDIKKFTFAKFEAAAVSGEIDIKDQKAIVSDMKLQTMQGTAEINAFADNSKNNRLEVVLESSLKSINIQQLFAQFNNFGQATLQDKNIKGYASADISFSGTWNNRLEANYPSLRANCKLLVERGELIEFKPLLSLSKFVDVQDLQHIRFSALQSSIQISDQTITINKTSIKNSALNLEVYGTHAFNNAIDYHIQLLINELLEKRRKAKEEDAFGPVEQDKDHLWTAFIRMTGTVDKPQLAYDWKGRKEKKKEERMEKFKELKQVLKDEIRLFKKDTVNPRKIAPETHFQLDKPDNNPPKKTLEVKKKPEDNEDF